MRKVGMLAWTMTVLYVVMTLTIGLETAAAEGKPDDHGMLTPAEIAWKDGPASLPRALKWRCWRATRRSLACSPCG